MASELLRIADIELGTLVQLGMAALECMGSHTPDAAMPRSTTAQPVREMRGMRAVDHVVRRVSAGGIVGARDRLFETRAGRQAAVGLEVKEIATGIFRGARCERDPIASST